MKYLPSPLSFSQERIFLIDSFLADNLDVRIYNVPVIINLLGELEVSKLNDAINLVINRHSVLRSTIKISDSGDLYQEIKGEFKYKLVIQDISSVRVEEKQKTKKKLISRQINHRFKLASSDPLFTLSLMCLNKNEYTLILVFHHIIMDEWSIDIFFRELEEFYNYLIEKKKLYNNLTQTQFDQYCKLQKERFESNYFAGKVEYWDKKLGIIPDYESNLRLPNVQKVSDSGFYQIRVDHITVTKIENFCSENTVTLFMFLIALYFILLNRITKLKDIYVATPVANRMEQKSEKIIGCFVSTIVIHSQIEDEMKFSEVLENVKFDFIDSFDNQDAPIHLTPSINDKRCIVSQLQNFVFELKTKNKYTINLNNLNSSYYSFSDFSDQSDSQDESAKNDILLELEYQIDTHGSKFAKEFMNDFYKLLTVVLSDSSIKIRDLFNNLNSNPENTYSNICHSVKTKQDIREKTDQKLSISSVERMIKRLNNTLKLSVKY